MKCSSSCRKTTLFLYFYYPKNTLFLRNKQPKTTLFLCVPLCFQVVTLHIQHSILNFCLSEMWSDTTIFALQIHSENLNFLYCQPKFQTKQLHRIFHFSLFPFPLKSIGFPKGVLLHFKTSPFTLQNESFYNAKGALLTGKRTPFEMGVLKICISAYFSFFGCSSFWYSVGLPSRRAASANCLSLRSEFSSEPFSK